MLQLRFVHAHLAAPGRLCPENPTCSALLLPGISVAAPGLHVMCQDDLGCRRLGKLMTASHVLCNTASEQSVCFSLCVLRVLWGCRLWWLGWSRTWCQGPPPTPAAEAVSHSSSAAAGQRTTDGTGKLQFYLCTTEQLSFKTPTNPAPTSLHCKQTAQSTHGRSHRPCTPLPPPLPAASIHATWQGLQAAQPHSLHRRATAVFCVHSALCGRLEVSDQRQECRNPACGPSTMAHAPCQPLYGRP